MICGPCLARLSLRSTSSIRTALRNASSATSRLDELIIHDTPVSTRKPKRAVRKRPADVQTKLFDLYREQMAVSQDGDMPTSYARKADVAEVIQELDLRGQEVLNRQLDSKEYDTLRSRLSNAFLSHQLRSYCRSKGIERSENATKSQLLSLILDKLWNITRLEAVSSESISSDAQSLSIEPIAFALLTRNARSPIHDKAGQVLPKIEIDRQNLTLLLKMSKKEREFMTQAITTFTDSVRTIKEPFPMTFDETFRNTVEKSTGTVIEQHDDYKTIHVSYLLGGRHFADEALTLLHSRADMLRGYAVVRTLVQADETYEAPCQPVRPRPCEADVAWFRTTTKSSVGSTLPPYVVSQNDFRPTFERSVNHVTKAPLLRPDDLFQPGQGFSSSQTAQTLRDIIADKVRDDDGKTIITFGHALSSASSSRRHDDEEAGMTTWCSDIPGLFSILSASSSFEAQDETPPTTYNLAYASVDDGERLTIEVRGKFDTTRPLDLVFSRGGGARSNDSNTTILRLPSHRADIKLDRIFHGARLSAEQERDLTARLMRSGLTAMSNDTRLPVLSLVSPASTSGETGDVMYRPVGTESVKRLTTRDGRLTWTVRRGSPNLGSGQELSLVMQKGQGQDDLIDEIGKCLSILDGSR